LCSTIIDHIETACQVDTGSRLAYYYFDFNDPTNQRLDILLRSLIVQLCGSIDSLPDSLGILYDECNRGLSNPAVESLVEIFFELLDDTAQTYVIIDGLDECPYDGEDSERSRFHESILARIGQCSGSYNFLFTSRDEYDIREAMKITASQSALHVIAVNTEKVDADVRLRVRRFVSEHPRIKGWSPAIRKEIEDALVNGSQGMYVCSLCLPSDVTYDVRFRWVDCQLTSIGNCVLPGAARKRLKQLPKTIYETYDRILGSISEENIAAARSALMFLAYSQRPLLTEEFADAVLINVEEQYFSPEERCDDPLSVILELCSSLVTVTAATEDCYHWMRVEMPLFGKNYSVVRFAHYSVKEYIVSEYHRQSNITGYHFSGVEAHHYITEALLIYIFDFKKGDTVNHYPQRYYNTALLTYAAKYWPKHCQQIPGDSRETRLIGKIHQIFDPNEPTHYMNWLKSYGQDYRADGYSRYHEGRNIADFPPPLYFAALIGDKETCEWLISKGCRFDDPSGYCMLGDPLQAAASGGHTDIVRLLLNHGASINTDHGYFGDALQAASFGGFESTVKVLLDNGAIINTKHGEYSTPLIAASQNGHFAVVKKLVERGADPEVSNRKHGKAIAGAAASGQIELVKLLLAKGNDINDPNGTRGSALYTASRSGDLNLVRMLIKAGADVNLTSGELHTALHAACNEGHTNVVKHLLGNGANVNNFGGDFDSALQACIDHGDLEVFQILLSNGADINHQGGRYHSPLRCAVYRGKVRAAEILIDAGAVFDDEIFLMAVEYEHKSLVQRMLLKGVDVNAQGPKGTALQLAIRAKDMDTAWALLGSDEIDLEARGGEHGQTALYTALEVENEKCVEELLRRGASVNAKGGEYGTPFTAAIQAGNVKLIQVLRDHGADINGYRDAWYYSPLIVAARNGLEGVVRTLLDAGMDVDEFAGKDEKDQQSQC
jgi:ankyrin repeat protein